MTANLIREVRNDMSLIDVLGIACEEAIPVVLILSAVKKLSNPKVFFMYKMHRLWE